MPEVIDNDDGTKTFAINSTELRGLKSFVDENVSDIKKVLEFIEGPEVRAGLKFVKSVIG